MSKIKYCPVCAKTLVEKDFAGAPRLLCPDEKCGWVFWNNPLPVVAGILELDQKVILIRNKWWPEKWFGPITGFLEKGESPQEGVLREVREEVGLQAEIIDFVGLYPFHPKNELIMAFHLKATGEIALGEEIAAYKAVPPERLRPWRSATGYAVADWLKSMGYQPEFLDL